MKIPSGFDFERGLVVTESVRLEIKGGVYWNEGDICNGEMECGPVCGDGYRCSC